MKKLLAILATVCIVCAFSACGEPTGAGSASGNNSSGNNSSGNSGAAAADLDSTPSGGAFTDTYAYNPPKDNYCITWEYYDENGTKKDGYETYARIGGGCSYLSSYGVYHASDEQQKYYCRALDGEHGDWMLDPGYSYEEWKSGYDEYGDSYGSCDAFEAYFMYYFRIYGFDEIEGRLGDYFVGTENLLGISCWVFDSKGLNAIYGKYWVDPSNGCCLKYMDTETGEYGVVTEYNLNYTAWTNDLAPASYDGIS